MGLEQVEHHRHELKLHVRHAGTGEIDDDDDLQYRIVLSSLVREFGQISPRDFPSQNDVLLQRIERTISGTLDMSQAEYGAWTAETVNDARMKEEERLVDVERIERSCRDGV